MTEKFLLKDALFNASKVQKIASEIQAAYPDFEEIEFTESVCVEFPKLELKERICHICDMLHRYLPNDYRFAINILLRSLPGELDPAKSDDDFGDFIYAPYSEFVRRYGCSEEHLLFSLESLREFTKRFSVEFAIRDFINLYPEETLLMLGACARSDHYHERRLASEGLRPKLPWAKKLTLDHHIPLTYLDLLFYDHTRYVTRSVANHLNDISKLDAPLVIKTLKRWKASGKQEEKEMNFMISHALRTLVKQGDEEALELLGYRKDPAIQVSDFVLHHEEVSVGEALVFDFRLEAREESRLMVDYIIHFRTKAGRSTPKVHKFKKICLKKGESIRLQKKHLFKANMTTRSLYAGEHKIELQINGRLYAYGIFKLK